jgi:hypothetical protein
MTPHGGQDAGVPLIAYRSPGAARDQAQGCHGRD